MRSRPERDPASRQREEMLRQDTLRDRPHPVHVGLEDSDVGVWDWDVQRDEVIFSPHWAKILGHPVGQPVSHREMLAGQVHPDDRQAVERAIRDHLNGDTAFYEVEHRRRDFRGNWRWILDRGRVTHRDDVGRPLQAAGVHRDVTYHKLAEEALWETEGRFRNAFQNAALGLAMGDVQESGLIIETNEALERLVGREAGTLIGRTFAELVHPDDVAGFRSSWEQLLRGDAPCFRSELRCLRPGGPAVRARLTLSLVRDTQGRPQYALAIVEDVTARFQAERKARAEQWLLRELLELHDRERRLLAYEIHDGLVQDLVASKLVLDGTLYRLETAGVEGLAGLSQSLDLLSKAIDEGRRLISDLRPMIIDERGILDALNYLVEEQGPVTEQGDPGTLKIQFEHDVEFERLPALLEGSIYRIVQEALTNVKRHAETDRVSIVLRQDAGSLELVIEDQGVGFDPRQVPAKRFGVRGIRERARLFGGQATVDSRPGEGTRVHVTLPLQLPVDESEDEWDAASEVR